MKHILTAFSLFVFVFVLSFSAFSYNIDGIDTGREWDGAAVYNLVDGESNCGVNFGVVKVKFDYETNAFLLCFLFSDPNLTSDNLLAGVLLDVEGAEFKVDASDGVNSENIDPYSFDGAIYLDINNGATCEVRVGVKAGLPKSVNCSVRFIDSQGGFSNYYPFTIINESYEEPTTVVIFSSNIDLIDDNTTSKKKATTHRKTTTKPDITIKTSPPYSYTGRTKKTTTEKSTVKEKTNPSTKPQKNNVTVIYYEKEVYISEVYVENKTTYSVTDLSEEFTTAISETPESVFQTDNIFSDGNGISLSKGTKYKKIMTVAGLICFVSLAGFGVYSAKKSSESTTDNNK